MSTEQTSDRHEFWLVWNPEGNSPRFKHDSKMSAINEAERLAVYHPGKRFYVAHVGGYFVTGAVQYVPLEDEIPF